MTTIEWLQVHRTLARVLNLIPGFQRWVSKRVWAELETDPAFVAGVNAGLLDLAAGRVVLWNPYRAAVRSQRTRDDDGSSPNHYEGD